MPEPEFEPIKYWRRHAHLLADGLLERLDEQSVSDYAEATPNQLIEFLQDFLREIQAQLDHTKSEGRLRAFSSIVYTLADSLDWLDNAHTGQTPRALVQVLKHLFEKTSPGTRFLARPSAEHNYSISDLGDAYSRVVDNFVPQSRQSRLKKHLEMPLKLVSFPRIERDNLLAHVIFGHEVGHTIATEFLENEEDSPQYITRQSATVELIEKLVETDPNTSSESEDVKLEIRAKYVDEVLHVRKRAMEEIVSDAVAILIFGPSAFFAIYELLWHDDWDAMPSEDGWYPPARTRVRLMLVLLDDLKIWENLWSASNEKTESYFNAAKEFVDGTRTLVSKTGDQTILGSHPVLKCAYEWIHDSLAGAIEFAKTRTDAFAFKDTGVFSQLPELLCRLELGIPPNEVDTEEPAGTTKAVDYRASLLATWMYKLRGKNPQTGAALSSKEVGSLHLQAMRAIEYVILQNSYAEYQIARTEQRAEP